MRKALLNVITATSLLLGGSHLCRAAAPATAQGAITVREFLGLDLGNNALAVLTNDARFPNSPDIVSYPARLEWPTGPDDVTPPIADVKNGYGIQIIGYVYPPTTGNYVFYIASDDTGNLFLSTDDNPTNKRLIAFEPGWNPVRAWGDPANPTPNGRVMVDVGLPTERVCNVSSNIALVQGQAYYIEAIVKEGIGGDNLAVAWVPPGGQPPANGDPPIPGQYLSTIDRTTLNQPFVRDFVGSGGGVWYYLIEPQDTVNQGTVQLTLDGSPATPTFTKIGTNLTISFRVAAPLAAGTTHTSTLNFTDSAGRPQAIQKTFVVAAYASVPPSLKTATFSGDGFGVFVHQIDVGRSPGDPNSIGNAEQQLADGFIDPATGQPYANLATPPTTTTATVVNWEQLGADINANPPQPDNFNTLEPEASPKPNAAIPGIPGSATAFDDNIAASITTYLELKQGWNRFGVNSDDGFTLRVSPGAGEVIGGLLLGSFNGGRGASDSMVSFWVQEAGVYPARLSWWEGGGGANVEFFSENIESGERILVNDRAVTGHSKAYTTGRGRAYVKSILPANGFTGANTTFQVKIQLVDDLTTVVDGSVSLVFDGATVSANVVNGATTTVTYSPPGSAAFGSSHTGSLIWTESTTPPTVWTNNFSFSVRFQGIGDLPANSFWIEAEDFNHTGGQTMPEASTMPYAGNAYDQLGATVDIDYQRPQEASSDLYRIGEAPNVPMDGNQTPGTLDTQRPGAFEVVSNYKMGWTANGAWYNYTRTIPAGLYTAFGVFSHGDVAADVGGGLQRVTAGATTTSQTVVQLGTFSGPAPGGWGNNTLVPLRDALGAAGVFKLPGGPVTIRLTTRNGDYDWFALVPVAGVAPKVTGASPAPNAGARRDATLSFTIEDFSTAVVQSSVRLIVDGADVTGSATITKPADITTVTYDPPGLMGIGSSHSYSLIYTDNGAPAVTQTNSANFTVHIYPTAGSFLIEAEDFNYGSGQTTNVASTMPYLGAAYTNLGAVLGVDYNDNDGRDSQPYRGSIGNGTAGQNVNHDPNATAGTLDTDRGEWSVTANYKIGWTGGGNWYNYTRTIPANTYQVWAALSFDGTTAGQLDARLERVTSDPTLPNQTVEVLGTFNAPGSGGWGANNLVQMKDGGGNAAVVSLNGVQTLRFNPISGDFDYFMLVPGAPPLRVSAISVAGGNVTINWTGAGTLYSTTSLTPPITWTTTGDSDGTYTAPVPAGNTYWRVQQ